MQYLTGPRNRIWVSVQDELVGKKSRDELILDLQLKVKATQVWFVDLDDNLAAAPAAKISMNRIGTSLLSPRFLWWVLTYGFPAKFIKSRESKAWAKYVENFLRSKVALRKVQELYTQENARQSLYPGVQDFYSLISTAPKFLVTRNIREIAEVYSRVLGFSGFFAEVKDKGKIIEQYLAHHPDIEIVGIDGDSAEDAAMIIATRTLGKSVVSFYSMDNPDHSQMDARFKYSISKDRRGLVKLLERNN